MNHSTLYFRRNRRGNYCGTLGGEFCTVFRGRLGGWSYFLGGRSAGEWFDTPEDAMEDAAAEARDRENARWRPRPEPQHKPVVPACISYFGLPWPTSREALNAAYRQRAMAAHPDRGGSHEAMTLANRMFEEARQWL